MQQSTQAPTPKALADLVARCDQINRLAMQLTAAEELRVAALASGILVMREVLALPTIDPAKLPQRQGRIRHWALTGSHVKEAETPTIHALRGKLVLDEHEQLKILSDRNWRGQWRAVTLWRSGEHGLRAGDAMEYLARLAELANQRAPEVARALLARSEAVEATHALRDAAPRARRA